MVALRFIFIFVLVAAFQQAFAEASANLSRSSIGFGESVTLTIITDDSDVDNFDGSAIEKDFDILSSRSSSQRSIVNFSASFQKTWQLELSPKTTGTITIEPIILGNDKTQVLTLNVIPAKDGLVAGQAQDLFLEVSTEKASYYSQEQIILTVKLNDALQLQNLQLTPLALDNSFIEELGQTQYQRTINSRSYTTYEVRYAIFAQASGKLSIPSVEAQGMQIIRGQRNNRFTQSYSKPVRSKSEPLQLNIKPPPEHAKKPWLPASKLSIHESFSQAPKNLTVGDSITRSIVIDAEGLTHEQLPTLSSVDIDGIKVYQDVGEQKNSHQEAGINSSKTVQQTLVFTKAGNYQLPSISIDWYNTATGKNETATLKSLQLDIKPDPALLKQQAATPPQAGINNTHQASSEKLAASTLPTTNPIKPWYNSQPWPWQLATGILTLLCIVLMFLLGRRKKPMDNNQQKPTDNYQAAVQAFEDACKAKDVKNTQKTLKHLAKLNNPKLKIYSLADVHRAFNSDSLQQFIIDLDKASVSPNHGVNWLLAKECAALFKQESSKAKVLPTLYPE